MPLPSGQQVSGALDALKQMLNMSSALDDQPGILYGLAQAQAKPQEAEGIAQFASALKLANAVKAARAAGGSPIPLSIDEQGQLDALGVKYNDVLYTPKQQATAQAGTINTQLGKMGLAAVANADGSVATDANGNPIVKASGNTSNPLVNMKAMNDAQRVGLTYGGPAAPKPTWMDKVSNFVQQDIISPVERDVLQPVGKVLAPAWNTVSDFFGSAASGLVHTIENPSDLVNDPEHVQQFNARAQAMRDQGYDPSSVWSTMAYSASGKAVDPYKTADLINKYGQAKYDQAVQYLDDPAGYLKRIETDPANFTTDATGQTHYNPNQLYAINTDDFRNLVQRVAAARASVGDVLASTMGLDPVTDANVYGKVSAIANFAASIYMDPLLVAGKVYKGIKLDQVGRMGRAPSELADIYAAPKGAFQTSLVSRTQKFLDATNAWDAAAKAGDVRTATALDGQIARQFPDLSGLRGEVTGSDRVTGWHEEVNDQGAKVSRPDIIHNGEPILTAAEFGQHIASNLVLLRSMSGKAAVLSPYLPGATSAYGARWLAGRMAGWLTTSSFDRKAAQGGRFIAKAEANPEFAAKALSEKLITDFMPHADDAVLPDGTVLASRGDALKSDLDEVMQALKERASVMSLHKDWQQEFQDLSDQYSEIWNSKDWSHLDPGELEKFQDKISEAQQLVDLADAEMARVNSRVAAAQAHASQSQQALDAAQSDYNSELAARTEVPIATMPSQTRAGTQYRLTAKGEGTVDANMRRYGSATGKTLLGRMTPAAIGERLRLSATRLSTFLPRNTQFDITNALDADKVFAYSRMFMTRADASALRTQWILGDYGTRKAIIDSMLDQMTHAAGIMSTKSGRQLAETMRTEIQSYSTAGDRLFHNGQPVALHPGQTNTVWQLPSFQEWHHGAAKIGLWDATFGRALTSTQADVAGGIMKLGWLARPATIPRNQIEGWARMALDGVGGDALKAHAASQIRNSEAWATYGVGGDELREYNELRALPKEDVTPEVKRRLGQLEQNTRVKYQLAQEKAAALRDEGANQRLIDEAETEARNIANSPMLTGQLLGRSKLSTRLSNVAVLALAGRAYRRMFLRDMDPREIQAIQDLGSEELAHFTEGFQRQVMSGTLGLEHAARETKTTAINGFGPAEVRRAVHNAKVKVAKGDEVVRWTRVDTDSTHGAEAFASAMALRVNDSPELAKTILGELEKAPADRNIKAIVEAMDREAVGTSKGRLLGWGDRYWPTNSGESARAITEAQVSLGKEQMAREMLRDYETLFSDRTGHVWNHLTQYIRDNNKAPDSEWINANLTKDQRPWQVYWPEITPLANGGVKGLTESLLDQAGAGYAWLVERPLQRTTTTPAFLASYAKERVALDPYVEALTKMGISKEAAGNLAKEVAVRNSWIKAESLIDDPGQKTQFDIVARNIFPFSRATQAMIRRWFGGLWRDPLMARKMMLAYEGAVHSGFIYDNAYGEPTFVYPVSGAMNMALRTLAKVPGFENLAKYPVAADMTGSLLMAVPGADNPFRMSAGPMVMIPLREIRGFMPGDWKVTFDQIDAALNGPIGVGQTWSQLNPTVIKKVYDNMIDADRNSALSSAMMGAIANLAATGRLPGPDASDAERQAFMDALKTQVRSQLYLRAVFGMFAPASPSTPTEEVPGSQADYAFHLRGAQGLSDEYKMILNDVGGDLGKANAIWTSLHPDKVVFNVDGSYASYTPTASAYEQGESAATASKAQIPATQDALRWMADNKSFIDRYGSVAAYFLPVAASGQPFSDQAYKEELNLGLRQKLMPSDFLTALNQRTAESIYYPEVDKIKAQIAQAKLAGDNQTATQMQGQLSLWEREFKAKNPDFAAKIASYDAAAPTAQRALSDLREMVAKNQVPDGLGPLLGQLLNSYDHYEQYINQHYGGDKVSTSARDAALAGFQAWAAMKLTGTPLADLWNGVFRNLNTNLASIGTEGAAA